MSHRLSQDKYKKKEMETTDYTDYTDFFKFFLSVISVVSVAKKLERFSCQTYSKKCVRCPVN
jgi:uncharacterized protein YegL